MMSILAAVGIMSAMPQEAEQICSEIEHQQVVQIGCREFLKGSFAGQEVVFALSGVGKVSAAVTATLMVEHFHVDEIIFTGVAGGGRRVEIGDIVIGDSFLQHDVDARPVFPQFFLVSLGKQILYADPIRITRMHEAAKRFVSSSDLSYKPKIHLGPIVSGDQFIKSSDRHLEIAGETSELLADGFCAIEMEGAAVAQACYELGVPFIVLRAISDKADQETPFDFTSFIDTVAKVYSHGVLKEYFYLLSVVHN